MAYPKGPTKETQANIAKVVKAAGKKGGSLADLAQKSGLELSVARYATEYAIKQRKLKRQGFGVASTYVQV